ncbi:MAG: transglutaminase family protein [Bradymonadales bacterium]|jgi:hypothetical protein
MMGKQRQHEAVWIQILKAVLLAGASAGFLWQIAGLPTIIVTSVAIFLTAQIAYFMARSQLRLHVVAFISIIFVLIGFVSFGLILNSFAFSSPSATIHTAQSFLFVGLGSGITFITRSLAQRYKTAQILEMALIAGVVVFIFFAHRNFNINYPRAFADWAFSEGYDPIDVLRLIGAATGFVALLLLLRRNKVIKVVVSLIILLLFSFIIFSLFESVRIPAEVENPVANALGDDQKGDSDEDKDDKDDKDDDKSKSGSGDGSSGGSSSSNKPQPVAIAVFYDEFSPGNDYFYFRQNVLSKYDGNHLVSSPIDVDVITQFPFQGPIEAKSPQNPSSHHTVSTSMYLVHDHPTPPQLSHATKIESIPNPDSKLFVSTYAVQSLGMPVDDWRMVGRTSIPQHWSAEEVEHYLSIPDDPRYKALSNIIVRNIDPRFTGDDIVKAISIRRWLEKEVYYTQKTTHIDKNDPTASFLFGSLRGYCVHIAHAAVYLLRSQGIAARVALGYAVDNRLRGANSAVLILSDQAHAWPEIHIDGVGWFTFDIAPEQGDVQPRPFVDQDLETLFGELARNDKSGGRSAKAKSESIQIPWRFIALGLFALCALLLLLACIIKWYRIIAGIFVKNPAKIHLVSISALDTRAMLGQKRYHGEPLESYAQRQDSQNLVALFDAHVLAKLGEAKSIDMQDVQYLRAQASKEAFRQASWWRIGLGIFNPFTWIRF